MNDLVNYFTLASLAADIGMAIYISLAMWRNRP